MEFNVENLFHRYANPPAIITAEFSNGARTKIYIGPEADIHAVIFKPDGTIIRNKSIAKEGLLPRLEIMPQVGPLSKHETVLNQEYVQANLSSALAPHHFRNQLNLFQRHIPTLRLLAEETWHGLQIRDLVGAGRPQGTPLSLMVRNDDYVSEVSTMGHGLQMWLQTMWFLARITPNAAVTLDEPDVYMHPDLQRRLIRHLRSTTRQIVMTTHSVEIMSEVGPEDILVIDRQHAQSQFASSFPAVQSILEHIGSAQNLQLAKLWYARKSVLVEGEDFRLLCDFFNVLYPQDKDGLTSVPNMQMGGWGGWQYAIGSSMLLRNSGGDRITIYCIFDSDYHTDGQKAARHEQARRTDVQLHIWSRKEIENYVIVPRAIHRLIEARVASRTPPPSLAEVSRQLEVIFENLKNEAFDGIAAELLSEDRGLGAGGANKKARTILDSAWSTNDGQLSIISGKSALSQLSKWAQEQFGVSITASALIRSMEPEDIPNEMKSIVTAIAQGNAF
jgi:hypothetical protein